MSLPGGSQGRVGERVNLSRLLRRLGLNRKNDCLLGVNWEIGKRFNGKVNKSHDEASKVSSACHPTSV
jgi:hypothetical protein